MLIDLSKENSILKHFVAELRDVNVQNDKMRFRRNLERIGEIAALEISKHLSYEAKEIETPLGISNTELIAEQPVLAAILRAGLPLHQGLLNYFDHAENAFISAYRKHHKDGTFEIKLEYFTSPNIDEKTLILIDPMVASGASVIESLKVLLKKGAPKEIFIVSAIASAEGVDIVQKEFPQVKIVCAAVDEELTARGYIVPGLGDAGDLAYGLKIQN